MTPPLTVNHYLVKILEQSVRNIETISVLAKSGFPHVGRISIKGNTLHPQESSFFSTLSYLCSSLLPRKHELMTKKRVKIRRELIKSIDSVKKHYAIIQRKLQEGTEQDNKWAKDAIRSINSYNNFLLKTRFGPLSTEEKFQKFIYELFGLAIMDEDLINNIIELPSDIFVRFDSSFAKEERLVEGNALEKIADDLTHGKIVEFTKNELDIFYMRAITLAKSSNIPSQIMQDLTKLMRNTPVTATVRDKESKETSSVISMVQTLTPFPGEMITVQGRFERKPFSPVPSVPDPKGFRISTIVTQTGFPHPSQTNGWALCNVIMPDNPLRLDLIPNFRALHKIKKQVAQDLLPEGRLNQKAKDLLQLKKEAFNSDIATFVGLHRQLSLSLILSAPYKGLDHKEVKKQIVSFYQTLQQHSTPFDYITQTHQLINKYFIERLYLDLLYQWQECNNPSLHQKDPKKHYQNASSILHQSLSLSYKEIKEQLDHPHTDIDNVTLKYILLQGQVLGEAATPLLLQYFSEKVGYAPPLLKNYEQYIQMCGIKQVLQFQQELEDPLSDSKEINLNQLKETMKQSIKADISFFQEENENSVTAKISHELERYYNSRYAYYSHISNSKK